MSVCKLCNNSKVNFFLFENFQILAELKDIKLFVPADEINTEYATVMWSPVPMAESYTVRAN